MKRFIKIWVRETIQLFLILIGIVLILGIFFLGLYTGYIVLGL